MLKLRIRWQGKCPRHPRFNPEKQGRAAVKGGCALCDHLADIFEMSRGLAAHAQDFQKRSAQDA